MDGAHLSDYEIHEQIGAGGKIIDFGLANTPDTTTLTQPGTVMGTAEYMSPDRRLKEDGNDTSHDGTLLIA